MILENSVWKIYNQERLVMRKLLYRKLARAISSVVQSDTIFLNAHLQVDFLLDTVRKDFTDLSSDNANLNERNEMEESVLFSC